MPLFVASHGSRLNDVPPRVPGYSRISRAWTPVVRDFVRTLAAQLAIAVPIAIVTPFVMLLVINVFFDGLYGLDPVTRRRARK